MNEQTETIEQNPAALRRAAEDALDELTASLTQVFKSVNKVHRAVSRLSALVDPTSGVASHKDSPSSEE